MMCVYIYIYIYIYVYTFICIHISTARSLPEDLKPGAAASRPSGTRERRRAFFFVVFRSSNAARWSVLLLLPILVARLILRFWISEGLTQS